MQFLRDSFVAVAICFCIIVWTHDQNVLASSAETVNIMVVIDTYSLIQDFQNKAVSKNSKSPTVIDLQYAYMIASQSYIMSGQASANLHVKCYPQDSIEWFGSSESNDFNNEVIVYHIEHSSKCLSLPQVVLIEDSKVIPADFENINNVTYVLEHYIGLQVTVQKAGAVDYKVFFGLYVRTHAEENQTLFGYFEWDPKITIMSPRSLD